MKKILYIIGCTLTLCSCGLYKNYEPQQIDTKGLIREDLNADTTSSIGSLKWEELFTDAKLQSLINEGLEHNSDLAIAKLNIDEAMASLGSAKGALMPTVDVAASGNLSSYDGSKTTKTYSVGPEVSWQVDIFGKLTNAKKAAAATMEEKQAYAQAVRTQLIAAIAEYYYTLESLDAKVKVTQKTIESWTEYVGTQKALMNAGQATRSDVSQAEASKLSAETTLEQLNQQISQTENSLCALIGRTSGTVAHGNLDDVKMPDRLSSGVPVDMLNNRPDVRQAEASLKSAFYNTNKARSAFYPSLTLSGSAGWTNSGGVGVSNPGALLLQAAGSLIQPILNNGQNRANLEIAKAQQEEAKIKFRQTVLDAGNEVNNALKNYQTSTNMIRLESQQIEKLKQTLGDTEAQMKYGSTNYLQVIVARQSLLSAQLNVLSDRYNEIDSYITLYQALGGGVK
jgi:multidrug efflux system outer membrane protein